MNKAWTWIIGLLIVVLVGAAIVFGLGLLGARSMPMFWGDARFSDWGDRVWHQPHMGVRFGFPVFGFFGLLLMIGLPLGLFGLVVLGVVLLVRAIQKPSTAPPEVKTQQCQNCGKLVESGWQHCPYCGESLKED